MFLRYFLCLSLVNLLLLASLKKKSAHGKFDCFLRVGDGDSLGEDILVDKAARDRFVLFWKAVAEPEVETFPCFQE